MNINSAKKTFQKNKNLVSNFLSLSLLQGLNVILPFLTIPYLTYVVGLENLGKLNFAYALAVFSQILIEYGFNTTTTRDISLLENNKTLQNQVVTDVFYAKLGLLFCCMLLQVVLFFTLEVYQQNPLLFLLQFGVIVFQAMFPVWYFQGIQRMKSVTVLNGVFKILFTAAIFIFIKTPDDYWKAPLYTCIGFGLSTLLAYLLLFYHFGVKLTTFSWTRVQKELQKGFYIFVSDLQTGSIANLNILILGFLKGDLAVGIYSLADKLIRAFSNLQLPVINTLFPYLSGLRNQQKTKQTMLHLIKYGFLLIFIALVVLFFLADPLFLLIFGSAQTESVFLFRILLLFPLFNYLNQVIGKLNLVVSGKMYLYFKIIFITSLFNIIFCLILTHFFGATGTAVNIIFMEAITSVGMYMAYKKHT